MKKLKDKELADIANLADLIVREGEGQVIKWGIQNRTPFEWFTYLTEEVGELAEAISEEYYRNAKKEAVVKEAIQVATLALKIAEMYKGE